MILFEAINEGDLMNRTQRIILASVILVVDTLFFILPIMALFSVFVILTKPVWFKMWVDRLYSKAN